MFSLLIGVDSFERGVKINKRIASRAIIYKNGLLLMVKSNKGDLKLPGGGVEKDEDIKAAVTREVLEETGYNVKSVKEYLGNVIERHEDTFQRGSYFEMISHYYLCEIDDIISEQKLDDYELELDFKVKWLSLDEAIANNEKILKVNSKDRNSWVEREVIILRKIKEYINK